MKRHRLIKSIMINRLFGILIFLLAFSAGTLNAQEYVTGLGVNEQVEQMAKERVEKFGTCNCGQKIEVNAMELPFFDDFSKSKVFPDEMKWEDRDVFVNQGFPYRSVNYGVATFDALNDQGKLYEDANWVKFIADYITSRPIRTDSVFSPVPMELGVADSLYLSFFYQPQGRGDEPEPWDSLVLQFSYRTGDTVFDYMDSIDVKVDYYLDLYGVDTIFPGDTLWAPPDCNPNVFTISYTYLRAGDWVTVACDSVMIPETKWKTVWEAGGMKLQEFQKKYKHNFVQVLVPLDDTLFLSDAFQFRFYNMASIANNVIPSWRSNCDQWNIDYVYLNYGRSMDDTSYQKICFADRAPSFLKEYQAMPYKQYLGDAFNSIAQNFKIYYNNLDTITYDVDYNYKVQQIGGSDGYEYALNSSFELSTYSAADFGDTIPPWQADTADCGEGMLTPTCPPVAQYFALDYGVDSVSYCITHYITSGALVDSIKYHQGFYNYFAYDDGIPELGYGIEPSNAECAYQFTATKPDSLRGVQIYFNRTQGNANELFFNLKVWRDNNGRPGQVAYSEDDLKVAWNESMIYGFYYYKFEKPVLVQGKFYVGWEQKQAGSLNVGFDANNDKHEKIFYTIDNDWQNSSFHGALMIRPVVGFEGFVGQQEIADDQMGELVVFPNPATGFFRFDPKLISHDGKDKITIYNILGLKVMERDLRSDRINVSTLSDGLYIVRMERGRKNYVARLMINN
jgi:hypothetical protein